MTARMYEPFNAAGPLYVAARDAAMPAMEVDPTTVGWKELDYFDDLEITPHPPLVSRQDGLNAMPGAAGALLTFTLTHAFLPAQLLASREQDAVGTAALWAIVEHLSSQPCALLFRSEWPAPGNFCSDAQHYAPRCEGQELVRPMWTEVFNGAERLAFARLAFRAAGFTVRSGYRQHGITQYASDHPFFAYRGAQRQVVAVG